MLVNCHQGTSSNNTVIELLLTFTEMYQCYSFCHVLVTVRLDIFQMLSASIYHRLIWNIANDVVYISSIKICIVCTTLKYYRGRHQYI